MICTKNKPNHIDSLTVFAHSAGAFNWTYFMPVFIHTQFEDFYFVQAPGVLLFSGENAQKNFNSFSILGIVALNVGDASSAIVRIDFKARAI